jgi:hypothetical protein
MGDVQIFRCFRTRSHCVYERPLADVSILALENAGTPYITLARELAELPFTESLENLIFMLEAYPSSSHRGASPELGILVSLNYNFKLKGRENQRNWGYTHAWIVDKERTHWALKDLPVKQVPNQFPTHTDKGCCHSTE